MKFFLYTFFLMYILNECSLIPTNLENVYVKSYNNIKYFHVPTSDEPVIAWMEVQKGIYPNVTKIDSFLAIGQDISIFIHLQDHSKLYDIKVLDCWVSDNQNIENSTYILSLTRNKSKINEQLLSRWYKLKLSNGSILHANFKSLKFPEKNEIYVTCDVELCFKKCEISIR